MGYIQECSTKRHWFIKGNPLTTLERFTQKNYVMLLARLCIMSLYNKMKLSMLWDEDHTRPYIALQTLQKLEKFSWKILTHLAYSSDIAHSL